MQEKTLLKIAFVLTIIAIILYGISVATYADEGFYTSYSIYKSSTRDEYIKYVLPQGSVTIYLPETNWNLAHVTLSSTQ